MIVHQNEKSNRYAKEKNETRCFSIQFVIATSNQSLTVIRNILEGIFQLTGDCLEFLKDDQKIAS